ncbi:hypothetical protein K469DRAFT_697730 [Zopfia rhizophila CBS 207.26]|uniref:Uncharacterized protein n=1 Tax=Zopfia rhizophila CBS 207.26 TaxID=1314779 RepID=A0A6A6EK04_9PEZI|nr:hypothetical protein K469DRAFT_697730 [Zopfia rhizophila CBS 207.26]
MLSKYIYRTALVAIIAKLAGAQDSIPDDLKAGFQSSGIELQVSYTGNAVTGFTDGSDFESNEVENAPTFALGDSSGILTTARYTILMVDTTCDSARTLHFAQANFKNNFDVTNIASDSQPLQAYKAPGSFNEKGDDRKYSFLMYNNPGRDEVTDLQLPEEGAVFDVKKFQDDNGFEDPVAGVGMVVKLGGTADCNGQPSSPGGGGAESSSAPASGPSSAPASSRVAASSAAASSAAPRTSAPVSQASSRAASATTVRPDAPQSTADSDDDDDDVSSTASGGSPQTSELAAASSVLQSGRPTSTVFLTSIAPDATGSSTTTGGPALQTDSGASGLTLATARCMVLASLMAFAGLLAW